MENQQPRWPVFSKAESTIVGVVLIAVFSMAFIANLNKGSVLSSVLNEPNPYTSINCNQLVDKMSKNDGLAIDEFESRCLKSE